MSSTAHLIDLVREATNRAGWAEDDETRRLATQDALDRVTEALGDLDRRIEALEGKA